MVTKRDLPDSSSSDDGSLFDPPFGNAQKVSEKTLSSRKKKEQPRKAASLKHARNEDATRSCARSVRQRQDKDDNERVKEIASGKAAIAMLPEGITSSSQLVWYHDTESSEYHPCRICEPAEALHIRLDPNSWDSSEVALVQALDLYGIKPFDGRDRLLVNKTSLQPYHGQSSDATKWSSSLLKRYEDKRREQARRTYTTLTTTDLEAESLFLGRILQAAREREYDSEQLSSDSSSIASEDLEVPYSENLLPDDDFLDIFSDKQTEPLRPGDVVEYTHPLFVKGDRRGYREATVLSTDPDRNPVLVLSNGECLPSDTTVKRKQVLEHGQVYKHPHGFFRPIECFKIEKRGGGTVLDGIREEGRRVGAIVDRNIDKFEKMARADGFAPMDLFHKRSNGAPKNRRVQKSQAAARGGESDSDVSNDAGMRTKRQSQNDRIQSAARPDRKGILEISSDSSLSESDLLKLSVDKRAPATEKNGITAFDIDSDSDDSNRLQRKRPRNVLGSDETALKQEPSALAIDSDIDSDECLDSSAGGREKFRVTKKTSTNTGSDVSSPATLGFSRPIRTRVSPKNTANQTKASSTFSRRKGSDLQGSRRLRLDDRHQADGQKHRVATGAKRKSWEESSNDESQSSGAGISPTRTKSRHPPTNVPSDRLEDSSSNDSMLQESSACKVASRRNNGKKSVAKSKTPEAVVDLVSSRKERSTKRLFSPRDACGNRTASVGLSECMKSTRSQHRRDPDPLSFPSSDDSSIGQQRKDGQAREKNSEGRTRVQVRDSNTAKSPCAHDSSREVDSDSSVISFAPQPGRPGTSKRSLPQEVTNGSRDEAPDDRLEGAILSVVSSSVEKSPAMDLTANEYDASGDVEKRLHEAREHPVPLGSTLSVPDNVGWMKKVKKKPAATTNAVESASFGLAFTKHNVRKSRPAPASKAVAVSSRHSSESPVPHTNGAIVPGKADEGSSSTSLLPERSNFSSRDRLAKPNEGDNLIDSDDGMGSNTQSLPRKRLFQSSERGKAAASFPFLKGVPVIKRHKGCSSQYGSKQKPRQF